MQDLADRRRAAGAAAARLIDRRARMQQFHQPLGRTAARSAPRRYTSDSTCATEPHDQHDRVQHQCWVAVIAARYRLRALMPASGKRRA